MAIRTVEAIILKRMPFRDTSLLVTFFSKENGKTKALAKGVRKEKKSNVAAFEPFTQASLVYYEKLRSDIHLLSNISILNSNSAIRDDIFRFGYASYLTELVDTFFGFYDPHPDIYELLLESFSLFGNSSNELVARVFEIKLLNQIGWLPALDLCTLCGSSIDTKVYFSPKQGGILCQNCERKESGSIPMSLEAVNAMKEYAYLNLQDNTFKTKSNVQVNKEIERAIRRFLEFRIDYPLRSRRFLSEIQNSLS